MREFSFDIAGARRTYWHFYFGFGLYIGVLLMLQSVLLWQLAALRTTPVTQVRQILVAMCGAWMIGTIVLWAYIFIVPALFSLVCTLIMFGALAASRSKVPGS
jgi:hypothetical protein